MGQNCPRSFCRQWLPFCERGCNRSLMIRPIGLGRFSPRSQFFMGIWLCYFYYCPGGGSMFQVYDISKQILIHDAMFSLYNQQYCSSQSLNSFTVGHSKNKELLTSSPNSLRNFSDKTRDMRESTPSSAKEDSSAKWEIGYPAS